MSVKKQFSFENDEKNIVANVTSSDNKEDASFSFSKAEKSVNSVVQRNAKILRDLRKKKGYTLYDLSKLSGLSPSYISRLEASARRLNTEILSKLALALGCKESDFFTDDVNKVEFENDETIGFKKNLPVYRVISEGVDVSDNPHSVIMFSSPMEHTFRPPRLSSSDTGFAIYGINNVNAPRYKAGDMLFFDVSDGYKKDDTVMIVDSNGYIFIGAIVSVENAVWSLKTYGADSVKEFAEDSVSKIFKLVAIEFE